MILMWVVMVNSDIRSVFVKKKKFVKYYCMMVLKWECIKMACVLRLNFHFWCWNVLWACSVSV